MVSTTKLDLSLHPMNSFMPGVKQRDENEVDGIDSMFTLIQGMFNKNRFRDIIRNFIYLPDSSKKRRKIFAAILNITVL